MAKIKGALDLAQLKTWEQLQRYLSDIIRQMTDIINGKINFSENFDAKLVAYTFAAGSTEYGIDHGLGRTPSGYIITKRSADLTVYDGSTANTDSVIYLQSSAAGTATILVF